MKEKTIMNGVSIVLSLLSGVALFLFGMSLMGEGLKKVAGNKLEMILYKLSNKPIKGVLLGAGVTAVIQSSSATTVMVVGFVNSGMMRVSQAIGIIMGANIGTSITGWILCLSYIEGDNGWAQLLSTATISAIIAIIGICWRMFAKKQVYRNIGDIMMGFAILMVGMQTMSGAVSPLKSNPHFVNALTMFSNPFMGILVGIAFTAVLQSASASIGILQALSMTGSITFATAFPITMGIGVGAACPVLLSSIGTNKNGKRTALVYLLNDLFGMIFWSIAFYAVNAIVHFTFMDMTMQPMTVALLNTVFRVATVFILFPFIKWIEKLVLFMVKDSKVEREEQADFDLLEERFLVNPRLAIEQSHVAMNGMAKKARKNVLRSFKLLSGYTQERYDKIQEKEDIVDKYVGKVSKYLMKVSENEMTKSQSKKTARLLNSLTDFERISDGATDISQVAKEMQEQKIRFSSDGEHEITVVKGALRELVDMAAGSFMHDDTSNTIRAEALWEEIHILCNDLKSRHINRLRNGKCKLEYGFAFNNLLSIIDNIGSHCINVIEATMEMKSASVQMKELKRSIRENRNPEFLMYFQEYEMKYDIDTYKVKNKVKN
ncbi:MAG: Na/Pi cotransporter family protein [Eubacteriales bacterium]|nr:Na/Pi cotransporter family protein [Eubacteriales bacterium]